MPKDEFMIRCELCLEWFHPTCVPLPRITLGPAEEPEGVASQAVISYRIACRETKYLGPCCSRSRRPEYKIILELLVGLNKLPLNMVEGVALQCLTNRAMKWQAECDKLMQLPDVKDIVEMIRTSTSSVTTGPVKKLDPDGNGIEISSPSPKIFFSPNLSSQFNATNGSKNSDVGVAHSALKTAPPERVQSSKELEVALCLAGMHHETVLPPAEREPLQNRVMQSDSTMNGQSIASTVTAPRVQLNSNILQEIENLLIEADLMEISAEESDILWKLYDLANPTTSPETRDLKVIYYTYDLTSFYRSIVLSNLASNSSFGFNSCYNCIHFCITYFRISKSSYKRSLTAKD